ncbi:hypothetical protein B0T17DRAFT_565994 [Bombardia bombarda]|uniref:Fe2OG dioxygenase domain-containing protein n=1 Tax=Bombardia bombarda TaxID=252184 RepID=A0AA39U0X4_9PEZI|nr:hypothetical protein B0T17DRAFT_565994 [Bombardia bombarda]
MASIAIPTVDLTPFTSPSSASETQLQAAKQLVQACHSLGFVKITGHGFTKEEVDHAFAWSNRLFDLALEDKMKAPHPAGPVPHRGYSAIGVEKIYSREDVGDYAGSEKKGEEEERLRGVRDYKESYEIGSEQDDQMPNIWLPDDVLPGFRSEMTLLYERLAGVGRMVLGAIGVGLELGPEEMDELMKFSSASHSQLRLLHYPAIGKEKLETELLSRLPAHNDWSAFTMLIQDSNGGLELRDPSSQEFVRAVPEEGALILNIGDMLQRFTNDYFISALHRVSVPNPDSVPSSGIPARYSIPFFVNPPPSLDIATLPRFVTAEMPVKYEPVRYEDYSALVSKYQYQYQGGKE